MICCVLRGVNLEARFIGKNCELKQSLPLGGPPLKIEARYAVSLIDMQAKSVFVQFPIKRPELVAPFRTPRGRQ